MFKQILNGTIKINLKNIFSRNKEKTVEEVIGENIGKTSDKNIEEETTEIVETPLKEDDK